VPTYTYECKKCGLLQDVFHPMNAAPRVKCKACGGRCRRLLGTGSGIIFKGSGFYETDYRKKDTSPADSGEAAGKESKTESKSDTKSDSESPTKKDE